MKGSFLPAAALELESAADYYDDIEPSLGRDFRSEVRRIVTLILAHQRIGNPVDRGTRTARCEFELNRFPYRLIYSLEAGGIVIVAVAHQHRRSGYWRNRVEEPASNYMTSRLAA
jgi:toxin ParE2